MTSRFSSLVRALLATVLLAGSFFAGMAVSVVKTASIMRQLAMEIREAQKRIKELEDVVTVSADDLDSGKVVVIGRLGSPLETMLTIRGTWRQSRMAKDSGLVFHVTHVNGKALDEPVLFHRTLMHVTYPFVSDQDGSREDGPTPSAGEQWEIRAYETGRFSGNPGAYQKELTGFAYIQAVPAWWRHFQTDLHGIMQKGGGDAPDRH